MGHPGPRWTVRGRGQPVTLRSRVGISFRKFRYIVNIERVSPSIPCGIPRVFHAGQRTKASMHQISKRFNYQVILIVGIVLDSIFVYRFRVKVEFWSSVSYRTRFSIIGIVSNSIPRTSCAFARRCGHASTGHTPVYRYCTPLLAVCNYFCC